MSEQQHLFRCVLAIIIASFLWGTTGTAASFAPDVSPLAIGAVATGGGGFLMLLKSSGPLLRQRGLLFSQFKYVFWGGLSVAIYPLAFYSSMRLAGVAIGTVISIASAPCFAVLMERFINGRPVTAKWMLSFLLGFAGILCLVMAKPHADTAVAGDQREWGILLGLLAGLTYAAYSWTGKTMIVNGVRSDVAMAVQFGVASCLLLPSLFFTGDNLLASSGNITVALYMALIPMFGGYLLFGYGLQKIDASIATLITLLEPVVATLLAVWMLSERFSLTGWMGIGLIAGCIAVQMIKGGRKAKRRRHAEVLQSDPQ